MACVLRVPQQLTFNGEGRPAQQPKRSSKSAASAVSPGKTEPSPAENAHTIMSCKLLLQLPRPAAMMAKLRRRSAAWWCRGRRRRTRPGQCLPGGAATLLPQSSLPRQWRRRRKSLVVVTKHQNTSTKKVIMCVLRVPVTTPTQSPASPFSNLMVSWMSFAASVPTYDGTMTLIGTKKTLEWREKHSDKEIQKKSDE